MIIPAYLKLQLSAARKNGLFPLLAVAARTEELPLHYLLAVASRETGIRNISGDGGHGRGVMQVDDRYHAIARITDFKRDPEILINYGAALLAGNVDWAKQRWATYDFYKIGAAAYNAGRGGAMRGILVGDCDRFTTGKNYGKDVLARAAIFKDLL